jgi:hypothetical protein
VRCGLLEMARGGVVVGTESTTCVLVVRVDGWGGWD